jgi:IS4 transposase
MLLGRRFANFLEESPITVMMRGIIENVFNPQRVDELFERAAECQYTRKLPFSTVAEVMGEVVFNISPSVGASLQYREETLPVSRKAFYQKLNGVETGISAALVRDTAAQLAPVIRRLGATLPPLLPGYRVRMLDGNHFAATERRLKELRTETAAPLPGQALVVFDPALKLVLDVFPCEDGHAQERSLLDALLPSVKLRDLWIADRNFCTLGFLFGIHRRGGKFVIRQHGNLPYRTLGKRRSRGVIEKGRVFEQRIEITDPDTGERLCLRRITVVLNEPTRDGDWEIHVVTNLSVKSASATTVATLYGKRWTIETMFQELTEHLTCEIKTLAYPKAAVFAFCLALSAYNALSTVLAALRSAHGEPAVEGHVSGYYVSLEIAQVYKGMAIAIPNQHWAVFHHLTTPQLAKVLKDLAHRVDLKKYQKHPRGPKQAKPQRNYSGNGQHVSTAKLLFQRNYS